jgi:hypothetical protein
MSETLINEQPPQRWHPFTRTAFRFAFVYLLLYNLPFPFTAFPYVAKVAEWYGLLWTWLVPRVARAVLNREVPTVFNGSGDRAYDYLLVACFLLISLIIAVIWTVFDRKRLSYPTLNRWLNLYVRFALGSTMIGYGAFKVISSQFGPPTLDRLMQTYGESSPMGLLWTFMGASEPYTMFVGFAEMISGILLFPRKTTTLGALMSVGVLSNVVALNFSYDVPVKRTSARELLHFEPAGGARQGGAFVSPTDLASWRARAFESISDCRRWCLFVSILRSAPALQRPAFAAVRDLGG